MEKLRSALADCGDFTSGDTSACFDVARQRARRYGLTGLDIAPEEYYRLALELGAREGMARLIRDTIARIRIRGPPRCTVSFHGCGPRPKLLDPNRPATDCVTYGT